MPPEACKSSWTTLIDDVCAGQWVSPLNGKRYPAAPYDSIIIEETLKYRDESTPFAIIQNGTREGESIILDIIQNYETATKMIDYSKPGIIVIGDTVAEHPAFFEEEIQRVLESVLT